MRMTFFVFAIRRLYKASLEPSIVLSECTFAHYFEADSYMSHRCDVFRKAGYIIVSAKVFKKVIEL